MSNTARDRFCRRIDGVVGGVDGGCDGFGGSVEGVLRLYGDSERHGLTISCPFLFHFKFRFSTRFDQRPAAVRGYTGLPPSQAIIYWWRSNFYCPLHQVSSYHRSRIATHRSWFSYFISRVISFVFSTSSCPLLSLHNTFIHGWV